MTYKQLLTQLQQADQQLDEVTGLKLVTEAVTAYLTGELRLEELIEFGAELEARPLNHLVKSLGSSLADLRHSQDQNDKKELKQSLQAIITRLEIELTPDQYSDHYWQDVLTAEQYDILRKHGTEVAFTGKLYHQQDDGMYICAACGMELFDSQHKYESQSGWPSFWQAVAGDKVILQPDASLGMQRTEVLCGRCKSHLGHLFDDGPQPSGERYCINSAALEFMPKVEHKS